MQTLSSSFKFDSNKKYNIENAYMKVCVKIDINMYLTAVNEILFVSQW
jgi:hypothetical protein